MFHHAKGVDWANLNVTNVNVETGERFDDDEGDAGIREPRSPSPLTPSGSLALQQPKEVSPETSEWFPTTQP